MLTVTSAGYSSTQDTKVCVQQANDGLNNPTEQRTGHFFTWGNKLKIRSLAPGDLAKKVQSWDKTPS